MQYNFKEYSLLIWDLISVVKGLQPLDHFQSQYPLWQWSWILLQVCKTYNNVHCLQGHLICIPIQILKRNSCIPGFFAYKTLTIFLSIKLGILIVCYLYGGISWKMHQSTLGFFLIWDLVVSFYTHTLICVYIKIIRYTIKPHIKRISLPYFILYFNILKNIYKHTL